MPAQVILKATRGNSCREEFVFTGKTHRVVGRASGCSLRLLGDDLTVSRYHCLLEIDAPMAWVEDLGSLNGTFVNGESIGRRAPDEGVPHKAQPRLLLDGDEVRIGDTSFAVVIDETPRPGAGVESMAEAGRSVA